MIPRVAVVILNWNGWRDTIECLESVARSDYQDFFVAVCDNASTDSSAAQFRDWITARADPRIRFLQNGANLGFAGGNNVGMRFALEQGADYIWILNNDTVVETTAIRKMVDFMERQPSVGICGATLKEYSPPHHIQTLGGYRYSKWCARCTPVLSRFRRVDYVAGASMFVRRSFVSSVGLMDEGYFLYFEEIDWITRGRQHFRLGVCPEAVVFHKEGGTIGSGSSAQRSLVSEYFTSRNRVRATWRLWPVYMPSVFFCLLASAAHRALLGRWRHAWMVLAGALGITPVEIEV